MGHTIQNTSDRIKKDVRTQGTADGLETKCHLRDMLTIIVVDVKLLDVEKECHLGLFIILEDALSDESKHDYGTTLPSWVLLDGRRVVRLKIGDHSLLKDTIHPPISHGIRPATSIQKNSATQGSMFFQSVMILVKEVALTTLSSSDKSK